MKIIITEEQYDKYVNNEVNRWIRRRYDIVNDGFIETLSFVNPCKFETYERYEGYFFNVFMDELHPHYYLEENFDYEGFKSALKDLYYVETTEAYSDGKEKCL